ncbi:hypothetical protein FLONG3_787 [Fusarium longipes]|uniref:Apple domain-containing protein n=1 Tax=Fusarium longipes TaxID=694270 RepID=A0A395T993_9HYPO|nr:hypothetical protein FLONG3_787 [Fusarium longipes]
MQSKIGLLAFAFASSNFVVAGPCKPSRPSTVTSVSLATSVSSADLSGSHTDALNSQTTIDTVSTGLFIVTTTKTEGSDDTSVSSADVTDSPTTSNIISIEFSTTTETKDSIGLSSSYTLVESDSVVTSAPTSDIPSSTIAQSSTTTEEDVVITNALAGGSFASRDPDSPSGLKDFGAIGNAEFHSGGCYKEDGSPDDGCASLTAGDGPNGKRGLFSRFASIYQSIKALPRRKYTIQFVYLVNSAGSQDCMVSATFGNNNFYSLPASSPGGTRVNWARVLEQVETIDANPAFAISLECSGSGSSSILVDSIFISDKVTPETIGNYHLEFGWYPPLETTTSSNQEPSEITQTGDLLSTSVAEVMSTTGGTRNSNIVDTASIPERSPSTNTADVMSTPERSRTTSTVEVMSTAERSRTTSITEVVLTAERSRTTSTTQVMSTAERSPTTDPAEVMSTTGGSPNTDNTDIMSATGGLQSTTYAEVASTTGVKSTHSDTTLFDVTVSTQPTTIADTTSTAADATTTTKCAVDCDLVDLFQANKLCNLYGVFVQTDAIYGFPGDDNSATRHRSQSIAECAEFCRRDMPGCKSVGFQKLSGRCFFSNTIVTQDYVRDGSDSQTVDWYNNEECFTCHVSGCESNTSAAPESFSTTEVSLIPPTTTATTQPTQSVCKPTCERIQDLSEHEDWNCGLYGHVSDGVYTLPGDEEPRGSNNHFEDVAECAEICRTLPGCISAGYQPASARCFFSNTMVTEVEEAGDSESANWNELKCFTCSGCGLDETSTSETPTLQVSTSDYPTSFITTTKAPEPTGACHNNHGEVCQISESGVESTPYVCIRGGIFRGQSWTEPRSKYPMQESQEQCAAICDTLEDCETSAFWGVENHCIFTSTKITAEDLEDPDPNLDDPSWDPRSAVWSHKSCWTCPTCVPNNSPLPKSPTCNYKQGDSCTRSNTETGVCNSVGWLSTGYRAVFSEWYPDQSSTEKCAAICRASSRCLGSSFINGQCYFANNALTPESIVTRPNINQVWDEPSCWDCPGCHS